MDASIVISSMNGGGLLECLLFDIKSQDLRGLDVEVLLLEAGTRDEQLETQKLGEAITRYRFYHRPGLSRTAALNFLFNEAQSNLIIRLDVRSHINTDYIKSIIKLSRSTKASNVAGVMKPVGVGEIQSQIADIMCHPLCFGGAKFRNQRYCGPVETAYLGAFNKDLCVIEGEWFSSDHPRISEDSELNYRIRSLGQTIWMDSQIVVQYRPRETYPAFFKLCYNYGVGRGLFVIKHRVFTAYRQLVPLACMLSVIIGLIGGLWFPAIYPVIVLGVLSYLAICIRAAWNVRPQIGKAMLICSGFIGCHLFWTLGFIASAGVCVTDRFRTKMI